MVGERKSTVTEKKKKKKKEPMMRKNQKSGTYRKESVSGTREWSALSKYHREISKISNVRIDFFPCVTRMKISMM